ncbi:futalosine hydrolase [Paenibacillus koleovorans]|uniref:futalosine hydrolase n=1 Tax=Paenibacillus koleovorans TaxID=121608 RepID=UPI000FDACB51|nr:futalosine hydrolase [Paenibacillus koleovorans]
MDGLGGNDGSSEIVESQGRRVLIVTAVSAERDAVLRGLRDAGRFDVIAAGVSSEAAAAAAGAALAIGRGEYAAVLCAGIGGGFAERAALGELVVATACVAPQLGAETAEGGFLSLDELGFGTARIATDEALSARLVQALQAAGQSVRTGAVLTVATVTGTAATAAARAARVPDAAAEGMEGFGVAAAARAMQLPVLELRAISNPVGPRDRAAWRIPQALQALEAASAVLSEVFDL